MGLILGTRHAGDMTMTTTETNTESTTTTTAPAYECTGPVRGSCGHRHRTISGALRCLDRDGRGCARQGGYSDRRVVRTDGEPLDAAAEYEIERWETL